DALAVPLPGTALGRPPCGLSTAKACPPLSLTPPLAWIEGGSANFINGAGAVLSPLPPNKLASPVINGLRPSPPPKTPSNVSPIVGPGELPEDLVELGRDDSADDWPAACNCCSWSTN